MQWIAWWRHARRRGHRCLPPKAPRPSGPRPELLLSLEALGWWALRYTPRVAWLDEALVLEGLGLRTAVGRPAGPEAPDGRLRTPLPRSRLQKAEGATSLVALARLRLFALGRSRRPISRPRGCRCTR